MICSEETSEIVFSLNRKKRLVTRVSATKSLNI